MANEFHCKYHSYFCSKKIDHQYSSEEVGNADYETIASDHDYESITSDHDVAINQADRPNLLRLDDSLKISTTIASDVNRSITRINTSQRSDDAFNGSAEMITTKGDGPIFEVYNNRIQKSLQSLSIDLIKPHNQDPTISEFNRKLQVQTAASVILEQLSGLPEQISNIQRSSMTLRKPCHAMTNDSVGDISQSLQPACDMQDCHSVTTAEIYTLPPTSVHNVQGSNGVNTRQHEKAGSHRQQSSTKIAHSFTSAAISNMHCDPPSSTAAGSTNSIDELKVPVNQNFKEPQLVHLVAINIPYDDSGVPVVDKDTSITDEHIVTECTASNSDEAMELQSTSTLDDITSEDHSYEDIF